LISLNFFKSKIQKQNKVLHIWKQNTNIEIFQNLNFFFLLTKLHYHTCFDDLKIQLNFFKFLIQNFIYKPYFSWVKQLKLINHSKRPLKKIKHVESVKSTRCRKKKTNLLSLAPPRD